MLPSLADILELLAEGGCIALGLFFDAPSAFCDLAATLGFLPLPHLLCLSSRLLLGAALSGSLTCLATRTLTRLSLLASRVCTLPLGA